MGSYTEKKGNLIVLAQSGEFDVIVHGANCFCTMGAGIALPMAKVFSANKFDLEKPEYRGDMNKLGNIDYELVNRTTGNVVHPLSIPSIESTDNYIQVVNAYTQYRLGRTADYAAVEMCFKKLNSTFKGSHMGVPKIGCGIGGLDWLKVKSLIMEYLKDVNVTVVVYGE